MLLLWGEFMITQHQPEGWQRRCEENATEEQGDMDIAVLNRREEAEAEAAEANAAKALFRLLLCCSSTSHLQFCRTHPCILGFYRQVLAEQRVQLEAQEDWEQREEEVQVEQAQELEEELHLEHCFLATACSGEGVKNVKSL